MSKTPSKTMPTLELGIFVRVVAFVFMASSATAFMFSMVRLLKNELFYLDKLKGSNLVVHYVMTGMMVVASVIGFLNSFVVVNRPAAKNVGRNIATWLLLDSVFEVSRVVYVFVCEVILQGRGPWQVYELFISILQYLVDSALYCQMILRH